MAINAFKMTRRVWRALLFRELQTRLFSSRTSMLWMVIEPLFHMSYLLFIFTIIKIRHVSGVTPGIWLLMGLISYYFFSWTSQQVSNAIGANKSLFAFRQILPFDTCIARAVVEAILLLIIFSIICFILAVFTDVTWPVDVLKFISAWACLWVLGIAWGMLLGIMEELFSDFSKVLKLISMPLYFFSGIIFPLSVVPQSVQDIMLFNPLVHAIEASRSGLSDYYHTIPGIDINYSWMFSVCLLLIAMALQRKFSRRLLAV